MPYNTNAIPPRQEPTGQVQLPLSRVKKIISQDPDVQLCSNNAAFVITLAAEMFIQHLAEEAHTQAKLERKPRRNIQYKDIANAVSHHDNLEFLQDVAPKTIPFRKAKAAASAAQARMRGEASKGDSSAKRKILANGHTDAGVKGSMGQASLFTLSTRGDKRPRQDDSAAQLELEMRQAVKPRKDKADVDMTG